MKKTSKKLRIAILMILGMVPALVTASAASAGWGS